jgi:TfoX/Sxy family transcriptional regulator of competence genes
MATSKETIDYILDQMSGEPVSARKMFGEHALYCGGRVIALVCDDMLFMKITDQGKEFAGTEYREGIAYPGAKPSMQISEDTLENREWLTELVRITTANVPLPKPKKLKKK